MKENEPDSETGEARRKQTRGSKASTSRRDFLKVSAGAGALAAGVGASIVMGQSSPTVTAQFDSSTIASGESTTVTLVLSEAPDGLAGYGMEVSLSDPNVATITGGSYPSALGLNNGNCPNQDDPLHPRCYLTSSNISNDGATASLQATDIPDSVSAGATNIELVRLTVQGDAAGETSLDLNVSQFDADGGGLMSPSTSSDSLTVDGGSTPGGGTATPTDTPTGNPDPTVCGDGPTITCDLQNSAVDVANTVTADLTLNEAPNGLSGYDVYVFSNDSSVAEITGGSFGPNFVGASDISTSAITFDNGGTAGRWARMRAGELSNAVTAGATNVDLGSVQVRGVGEGSTKISVSVFQVDDDAGSTVNPAVSCDTVTVNPSDSTPTRTDTPTPSPTPSLDVSLATSSVQTGSGTTATLSLSSVPNGLSGFDVDVTLDSSAASIQGATFPSQYGETEAITSSDGTTTTLRGVDLNDNVQAGDSNVELATVNLQGESAGSATVGVTVNQIDADGGALVEPTTGSASLTVSETGGDANPIAELDPSTTSAAVGERITFQVVDTSPSDRWITALDWTFGDGTSATGWWNAHTYQSAGTYTVELVATDQNGDTTTFTIDITVS